MKVFVDLAGKRRLGHIVKINSHTLWVKVMDGAKTYTIVKRNYVKHNVLFEGIPVVPYPEEKSLVLFGFSVDDCQGPFCSGDEAE